MSSADSPSLLGLVRFTVTPPVRGDFPLFVVLKAAHAAVIPGGISGRQVSELSASLLPEDSLSVR